jgi:hypothetical protein
VHGRFQWSYWAPDFHIFIAIAIAFYLTVKQQSAKNPSMLGIALVSSDSRRDPQWRHKLGHASPRSTRRLDVAKLWSFWEAAKGIQRLQSVWLRWLLGKQMDLEPSSTHNNWYVIFLVFTPNSLDPLLSDYGCLVGQSQHHPIRRDVKFLDATSPGAADETCFSSKFNGKLMIDTWSTGLVRYFSTLILCYQL